MDNTKICTSLIFILATELVLCSQSQRDHNSNDLLLYASRPGPGYRKDYCKDYVQNKIQWNYGERRSNFGGPRIYPESEEDDVKPSAYIPRGINDPDFDWESHAGRYEFPWAVRIEVKFLGDELDCTRVCTGFLYTYRHVVTSGHCLLGKDQISGVVILGEHLKNPSDESKHVIDIQTIMFHPNISVEKGSDDIAVITLRTDAKRSKGVRTAKTLNSISDELLVGKMSTAAGWGLISQDQETLILRTIISPIISNDACQYASEAYWTKLTDEQMCAVKRNSSSHYCPGDAGAPVEVNIPDHGRVVIGVLMGRHLTEKELDSVHRCNPVQNRPDVFERLDKHTEFLKSALKLTGGSIN